jgi:hypothetical protein
MRDAILCNAWRLILCILHHIHTNLVPYPSSGLLQIEIMRYDILDLANFFIYLEYDLDFNLLIRK